MNIIRNGHQVRSMVLEYSTTKPQKHFYVYKPTSGNYGRAAIVVSYTMMNGTGNLRVYNDCDTRRGWMSWFKLIAKVMMIMTIMAIRVDTAAAAVDTTTSATTSSSCVGTETGGETCTPDQASAAGVDDVGIYEEEAPKVGFLCCILISSWLPSFGRTLTVHHPCSHYELYPEG